MKALRKKRSGPGRVSLYLEGQLLVAMPAMSDKRFARSVIYMCAHSAKGAMGLIINQRASHISYRELLEHLKIVESRRSDSVVPSLEIRDVHIGGPVETARGFVLHSADYASDASTLSINGGICLTATVDILRAIARGSGPDRSILALGYAVWRAGQLESEILANGWLHCPADMDLIFDPALDHKYQRAMSKIGINPTHLVSAVGHA